MSATESFALLAVRRQIVLLAALGLAAAALLGAVRSPDEALQSSATVSVGAEPADRCLSGGGMQARVRPEAFRHDEAATTQGAWDPSSWSAADVELSWDEGGQPVIRNIGCEAVLLTAAYGWLHNVVIEARCAPGDVRRKPVEPVAPGTGNSYYRLALSQGESVSLPSDGLSSTCETEPIPIDVRYVLLGRDGERIESPWRRTPVCEDLIPGPAPAATDVDH